MRRLTNTLSGLMATKHHDGKVYVSIGQGGRRLGSANDADPPPPPPQHVAQAPAANNGALCAICLEATTTRAYACPSCANRVHVACRTAWLDSNPGDVCPTCRYSPDPGVLQAEALKHRNLSCGLLCLSFFFFPTLAGWVPVLTNILVTLANALAWYLCLKRVLATRGLADRVWWLKVLQGSVAATGVITLVLTGISYGYLTHSVGSVPPVVVSQAAAVACLNTNIAAYAVFASRVCAALAQTT